MSEFLSNLESLREWHGVDRHRFETEVLPLNEPAILRGLVATWPSVGHGRDAPLAIARYLAGFDNGLPVDALMIRPENGTRIFYDETMSEFNFLRNKLPLSHVMEQVLRYAQYERAPAVAVQSALIDACLPGFTSANVMPLLDADVGPRIWVGTAVTTPAHFDEAHNIACVVAGHRRFTLLPPSEIDNLYVGPLDYAPTRTPMSLVDFRNPDLVRFPRFEHAAKAARIAELNPGDAIYIPSLWWHHVESLASCNVLVNYWWMRAASGHSTPSSAWGTLLDAVKNLRGLPDEQRHAWREIFEHYVFDTDRDVSSHIPPARRGVLDV
jgi:hypothetical protein